MDKRTKEELKLLRKQQELERMKKEAGAGRMRTVAIWLGVILFLGLGVYAVIKTSNSPSQTPDNKPLADTTSSVPPITKDDNSQGPENAKVTLIEYGDFQCPACGHFYPVVHQLLQAEKGKIRFVFRNFPLTQVHQNAMLAAQAGYAAGQQDKFWLMYDLLYPSQDLWAEKKSTDAEKDFTAYAQKMGLDMDKFKEDLHSKAGQDFINAQENKGVELGVNATPTFYVNNRLVNTAVVQDFVTFKKMIDDQLATPTPKK